MKTFLELFPLAIFFIIYKLFDIYYATGALMLSTLAQVIILYAIYKKVKKQNLITLSLIMILGSCTILLQSDEFIKWKVTIINYLFALIIIASQLLNKPILKSMLGYELSIADSIMKKFSYSWAGFFIFCGTLNIYIANNMSQDAWVNFKVFGLLGLTTIFSIASIFYILRNNNKKY